MLSLSYGISGWTAEPFPTSGQGIVAPFWSDVRVRYGIYDRIWYRQTSDPNSETLQSATALVRENGCPSFTAQWTFVVTWHRVARWGGGEFGPVSTCREKNIHVVV